MTTPESRSNELPQRLPVMANFGEPFRVPLIIRPDLAEGKNSSKHYVIVDESPFLVGNLTGQVEFHLNEPMYDIQPSMFPLLGVRSPVEVIVAVNDVAPSELDLYRCILTIAGKNFYSGSNWDSILSPLEENQSIFFHSWRDVRTGEPTIEDTVPLNPQFVREYMTLTINKDTPETDER